MIFTIQNSTLKGEIIIPASKSDAQRALLCAALAKGTSRIRGLGKSEDELAMLEAIQKMGAKVENENEGCLKITGIEHLTNPLEISANESGLAFRLLTGACAAFSSSVKISGNGSLLERTMQPFEEMLLKMGVEIETNNGHSPILVKGPLKAGKYEIDGSISSQFISGILFGLSNLKLSSELNVKNLVSRPYLDMTLNTLKAFGVQISENEKECFQIVGNGFTASDYTVEADWSSASYWLVAAALDQELIVKNLSLESLQADKALLVALQKANCKIIHSELGISIDGTELKTFDFDATDCPDLFPALVVLAAGIEGISKIIGTKRLLHKESNRALSLQSEFGKLGMKIELKENEMWIHGTGKLTGGKVDSHNDHRIAMSLGISGCLSETEIILENAEAVAKSYPSFWKQLESLLFSK